MLIIVDFTALDPNIHNKNDKNSVNDPDAKRAMLKKLEREFTKYAGDADLISTGTVITDCEDTMKAWRARVAELRDQHPGHFFAPVWPA